MRQLCESLARVTSPGGGIMPAAVDPPLSCPSPDHGGEPSTMASWPRLICADSGRKSGRVDRGGACKTSRGSPRPSEAYAGATAATSEEHPDFARALLGTPAKL